MKRALVISIALATLAAVGCQPSVDTKSVSGTTPPTAPEPPKVDTATPVPAEYESNEGYRYYSLSRKEPARFAVTLDGVKQEDGTETVTFKGMVDGKAKFDAIRTGSLARFVGSEFLAVDSSGVILESVSTGELQGKPVMLPATLTTGKTWSTDFKVILKGQGPEKKNEKGEMVASDRVTHDLSNFKVVGPQKVTTKAGTFDAILVEQNGNDTLDDQKFSVKGQHWFVKDRGPVKIILTTSIGAKTSTITIEALPEDKQKA